MTLVSLLVSENQEKSPAIPSLFTRGHLPSLWSPIPSLTLKSQITNVVFPFLLSLPGEVLMELKFALLQLFYSQQ